MPGGRFVCTLHNPLLRAGRADGQRHLVGTFPRGGGSLTVSGIETLHNGVVTRRQIFELADADGRIAVVRELAMTFELIPPERLVATARACGLKLVRALGSYQGEPYDPEGSARFIAVLEHSGA